MPKQIEIRLEKRNVRAIARLLEEEAPETAKAIWEALPLEGQIFHAKYANNEVYTLVTPFAATEPELENATIMPIPGDVAYIFIPPWMPMSRQMREECKKHGGLIDLAIFYGRDNLLLSAVGFKPATIYARIEEGLSEFAEACNDVWWSGAVDERLSYRRVE
jgi:hypothetical protein